MRWRGAARQGGSRQGGDGELRWGGRGEAGGDGAAQEGCLVGRAKGGILGVLHQCPAALSGNGGASRVRARQRRRQIAMVKIGDRGHGAVNIGKNILAPLLTPKSEKRDNSQYYDELTPVYTTVLSSRTLGAPTDHTLPKHCLT